jgi:phage tail-like protein
VRGLVEELETPQPLGAMLPGVYQADDFAQRFTSGLDEVLAPVLSTLDNLAAYFDPRTAPGDFLEFLASWVGIYLQPSWTEQRRRQVILGAVDIHRRRATVGGIRDAVSLILDARVEIVESGASAWSQAPGAELPGRARPELVIRVDVPEISDLEMRRLDGLIALVKPAHVPHRIELGRVPASGGTESEPTSVDETE